MFGSAGIDEARGSVPQAYRPTWKAKMKRKHLLPAFLALLAVGAAQGWHAHEFGSNWAMRAGGLLRLVGWGGAVLIGVVLLWALEAFPAQPDPNHSRLFPNNGRWLRYLLWLAFVWLVLLPFTIVF